MAFYYVEEGEKMKFLDLFSGIGGFRLGMESAGHECVGYVEWDKFARKSYEAIHNIEGEWTGHDITTITDEQWKQFKGNVDIICGGFPCQAFSVAGKRRGFEDTRGTMFFEIARAAKQIKPRFLLLENVKGLLSHDKGKTFSVILNTLDELGYDAEWQVCNSKDFGVPQNRERVFIVGHLRGSSKRKIFPIGGNDCTIDSPSKLILHGELDIKGKDQIRRVYDTEGLSPTLTTMQGGGQEPKIAIPTSCSFIDLKKDPKITEHSVMIKEATKKGFDVATEGDSINLAVPGSKTRRGRVGKGIANTLDTGCQQGVLVSRVTELLDGLDENKKQIGCVGHHPFSKTKEFDGYKGEVSPCLVATDYKAPKTTLTADYRIRKLTPRECWRLQGFPDWAFDKAAEVNSDTQLYKQAGNSVTVNVIEAIAKELY